MRNENNTTSNAGPAMQGQKQQPKVGMLCMHPYHKKMNCRIIAIHDFGTVDVAEIDGDKAWRLSGLDFAGLNS